jgi:ABC-type transport system involved in multi-copper enzyme maturation permease subunit
MCIIATALHSSPQAQCFLLMITNFAHLVVILFSRISQTLYFKLGKVFELAFFAGLEILILVCQSQQETLTTRGINTLGSVGIALLFAIILLSFIRTIYTFMRIYKEYNPDPDHNKYASIKTRNEDYFTINGDHPPTSERD